MIEEETSRQFTPVQASAYKQIQERKFFSFSAPTSSGKSYLFRELIKEYDKDIIIVVPSRALIAEYMFEVLNLVKKDVLVLQFIENINIKNINRRIYIITPERGPELFKKSSELNVGLFLFDEAQISEEKIRGMKFDAFVRRSERTFPEAKKVFTHPFVENPEAQLRKHQFEENSSFFNYKQYSVGKIYVSHNVNKESFQYFSPFEDVKKLDVSNDFIEKTIRNNGTLLVYISKSKIYKNKHIEEYAKYIDLCSKVTDPLAQEIILELKDFIGATEEEGERYSRMIYMMERGVVIHHGSIPLKARLLIERFVNKGYAKLCFATSTLIQGINMPFDIVYIDNFQFQGEDEGDKSLQLKNLIGRSGRSRKENSFDFGYVVVKNRNTSKFSERLSQKTSLNDVSRLDQDISDSPEDLKDIAEAIKNDDFDADLQLPKSQIERLKKPDVYKSIEYILDNFINGSTVLTQLEYRKLKDSSRRKIKTAFKNIFIQHLRRNNLTTAEQNVLSTAVSILIWKIEVKSFSQIVALRYAYLTEKDERLKIDKLRKENVISLEESEARKRDIKIPFSQVAYGLPNVNTKKISLFEKGTSVLDCSYDKLIYDTYDYLDKVISLSLADPLCAAFQLYYNEKKDNRALVIKDYIRYGTHDLNEIWLLKYGFEFEDMEWIMPHIKSINKNEIEFYSTINSLNEKQLYLIQRYLP